MRRAAAVLATALLCAACGSASRHGRPSRTPSERRPAPTASATAAPTASGPAVGITEDDADLLWNPASAGAGAFVQARRELTALHPTFVRLLVNWAALQPNPDRPPALGASVDGCAREVGPCGAYAGMRAQLAAIASQQRAAGEGAFQVVLDILYTPAWAASAPHGCELAGAAPTALAPSPAALPAYRALIRSILALAKDEGVALRWWSPWNEPNDPRFLNPQREGCSADSPPLSTQAYTQLARAMAQSLHEAGGEHEMILGELQGLTVDSPRTTSIQQFVAAIPEEVACDAAVWSVHAYASYAHGAGRTEPVRALQSALAARGGCAGRAQIWVTEAGAGAPHAGQLRPSSETAEAEGCRALASQLARWYSNPRVGAVFQYTFREDPDFQVGLLSPDLQHLYPTYRLWLRYSQRRLAGEPPPPPGEGCGEG